MSFDVKIGYNRRAASKIDQVVVLQDVEGRELTDDAGAQLITSEEGFLSTELTASKALSVGLPVTKREVTNFLLFFLVNNLKLKNQIPALVEIQV